MHRRLWGLLALLCLCCVFYMVWGVHAPWSFVLPFRGAKLGALILVGSTVATASLLFQTITHNRILTPSIMGFDALYLLLLAGAVFWLGGMTVAGASPHLVFLITACALMLASLALFGPLLRSARGDLLRMVLTGIIFGALFRSLTSFLERMIDPNEFAIIQAASFARFTQIETDLLALSACVSGVVLLRCWWIRHRLDVLALGRDAAISLGVAPRWLEMEALMLIAVLVSVSTALVGPLAFLGLLVLSVARLVTPSEKHAVLIPSAALIAAITLVGGQTIMEHVMNLSTPLVVVIDLLGGAVFLALLMKGSKR